MENIRYTLQCGFESLTSWAMPTNPCLACLLVFLGPFRIFFIIFLLSYLYLVYFPCLLRLPSRSFACLLLLYFLAPHSVVFPFSLLCSWLVFRFYIYLVYFFNPFIYLFLFRLCPLPVVCSYIYDPVLLHFTLKNFCTEKSSFVCCTADIYKSVLLRSFFEAWE
jgi:hypothetical protein